MGDDEEPATDPPEPNPSEPDPPDPEHPDPEPQEWEDYREFREPDSDSSSEPEEESSPFTEHPNIAAFVEEATRRKLGQHGVWPENLLQVELETAGVYQDFSGRVLQELIARGGDIAMRKLPTPNYQIPYLVRNPPPEASVIQAMHEKTQRFMDVLRQDRFCGGVGELVAYTAACKATAELQEKLGHRIAIYAQASTRHIVGLDWEYDYLFSVRNEIMPVDVFNGIQFLLLNDRKARRAREVRAQGRAKPLLVCRLASKDLKDEYLKGDGLVLDQGKTYLLKVPETALAEALAREFGLDRAFIWTTPITVAGRVLDGITYREFLKEKNDANAPKVSPEDFAQASDQLPDGALQAARGFVRLLYVHSEFRNADDFDGRAVALLMQQAYNILLRRQAYMEIQGLYDMAWTHFFASARVRRAFKGRREDDERTRLRPLFDQRIQRYHELRLLRKYGSRVLISDARHPSIWLSFSRLG